MLFQQDEIDKFNTFNRKLYTTKNEQGKIEQRPIIIKTKDQAINEVEGNADPEWIRKANEALDVVIANTNQFTSDQIWEILDVWQVPRPNSPSAMGSIIRNASKSKRIKKSGRFIPSAQSSNHQRDVAVWEVV